MAIPANVLRPLEAGDAEGLEIIPSPANVRARAAEIRRGWSKGQKRRRAQLAHYLLWRRFLDRK
jgi:hypothetical protein